MRLWQAISLSTCDRLLLANTTVSLPFLVCLVSPAGTRHRFAPLRYPIIKLERCPGKTVHVEILLGKENVEALARISSTSEEISFRPRPYVSGYFWIRNFFFPDTASVHTHTANSQANPEIFESALQSENFLLRYHFGYVWTVEAGYFLIRCRHKISASIKSRNCQICTYNWYWNPCPWLSPSNRFAAKPLLRS